MKWLKESCLINIFNGRKHINIIRLKGGLGNQMFQYAFGKNLEIACGKSVYFDLSWYVNPKLSEGSVHREFSLKYLNTELSEATIKTQKVKNGLGTIYKILPGKIKQRFNFDFKLPIVMEPKFNFTPEIFTHCNQDSYFDGYWQSPLYFKEVKNKIKSEFTLSTKLSDNSLELQSKIIESGGVCLNVRRGDYASNINSKKFHGLLEEEYYRRAWHKLKTLGGFESVFIFSDDIEWCKANLRLTGKLEMVTHEHAGPHFTHYLELMKSCSGFIIPNSTFGWWAAWLSEVEPNKIVAPRNWFTDLTIDTSDLIPNTWLRE
jgi:hypothetical protein